MDIPINARVHCSDGLFGRTTNVILKPNTEEITHITVADRSYPETAYLVSVDHIVSSSPDMIQLNCTRAGLSKMPVFNQTEFIDSEKSPGGNKFIWPYFYAPDSAFIELDKENIPADEIAIRPGAGVEATDGYIGKVDGFLIKAKDDCITHILMREGHLWGKKDIFIPVSEIDYYQDNTVHLKLDKHAIETQPTIPVWQGPEK